MSCRRYSSSDRSRWSPVSRSYRRYLLSSGPFTLPPIGVAVSRRICTMFVKSDFSIHFVLSRRRRSVVQRTTKEGFWVHVPLRTPDEYAIGVSLESLVQFTFRTIAHGAPKKRRVSFKPSARSTSGRQPKTRPAREESTELRSCSPGLAGPCSGGRSLPEISCSSS
jgi:hypothetical protein